MSKMKRAALTGGRRLNKKQKLTKNQKQMRLILILFAVVLLLGMIGMLWLMNRVYRPASFNCLLFLTG